MGKEMRMRFNSPPASQLLSKLTFEDIPVWTWFFPQLLPKLAILPGPWFPLPSRGCTKTTNHLSGKLEDLPVTSGNGRFEVSLPQKDS